MATISETLAMAIQHHRAGRLPAAEQFYRQILQAQPDHADALHLLGAVAHQMGKPDEAAACWRRVLQLKPEFAEAHSNLGVALRDQGKLDEALACWRRALELKPDSAEVHNNLGNALREQGHLDEAVACLRRALELKPDYAEAHCNLGNALREQGKPAETIACWRRALELKPDYAEAHNNLGNALREQGKLAEAAACYRRAVQLKPDSAEVHNNLGIALRDQGKLDEAIACYRRALELNPNYAETHSNLGNVCKDQGKLNDAVACYRRALELKPDFAEAYNNLGNAWKDLGKPDETIACYRRALELKPDYAEAHNNLGNAWKDQRKLDDAVACYRRALELKPDFAEAHNNLGTALKEAGDLERAEDSFRAALRNNPRFAAAHYELTELLGGKLPAEDLARQRRLLEDATFSGAQRLWLHFGLGQALDARGEYAEAAEHLERANALQRSEWRQCGREYDPQEHAALVTRLIAVSTPDFFARIRGFGLESELPVFVVGLPRSGTTLVEQILASHSQVFGAGEITLAGDTLAALGGAGGDPIEGLRQLDRETARQAAARHLEQLRAFCPAALRIVDKMPENYLYLGLLASLFPRAKFIHCRRDLRDVAVSCWMTHFREVRWANDRRHVASRFHEYRRIMEHWRKVLPAPLLEVDYEETVADLEGVARKLVTWCGLAWEPGCLEFHQAQRPVRTASSVQVRQPLFQTSLGRWRHYEQALASLFAELETEAAPQPRGPAASP